MQILPNFVLFLREPLLIISQENKGECPELSSCLYLAIIGYGNLSTPKILLV